MKTGNITKTMLSIAAILGLAFLAVAQVHRTDSVIIHVRIFPKMAEAIPVKTQWNLEARLLYEITYPKRTGAYTLKSKQSAVANDDGEVTFILPIQEMGSNFEPTYDVRCDGGWAYVDAVGQKFSASKPGEHAVTLNMKRK